MQKTEMYLCLLIHLLLILVLGFWIMNSYQRTQALDSLHQAQLALDQHSFSTRLAGMGYTRDHGRLCVTWSQAHHDAVAERRDLAAAFLRASERTVEVELRGLFSRQTVLDRANYLAQRARQDMARWDHLLLTLEDSIDQPYCHDVTPRGQTL